MTTRRASDERRRGAEAAEAVTQTTGPMRALVDELETTLQVWMTREPGEPAPAPVRESATLALKAADHLAAELVVFRTALRNQMSVNDSLMMILAAEQHRGGGRG